MFQGWSKESLTRLARLGYFKAIPEKTIIMRQGDQPSHFHILRKGIVKVTKTPSRFLELQEKKSQVENDIKRIETLYSYHHTLEPKHKLFDIHNPRLGAMVLLTCVPHAACRQACGEHSSSSSKNE